MGGAAVSSASAESDSTVPSGVGSAVSSGSGSAVSSGSGSAALSVLGAIVSSVSDSAVPLGSGSAVSRRSGSTVLLGSGSTVSSALSVGSASAAPSLAVGSVSQRVSDSAVDEPAGRPPCPPPSCGGTSDTLRLHSPRSSTAVTAKPTAPAAIARRRVGGGRGGNRPSSRR